MNEDENEDEATRAALRDIAEHGSDLTQPMVVDFFLAVPNRAVGDEIARLARSLGFDVRVVQDKVDRSWTCYCSKRLVPRFEDVRAIEKALDALARPLGGHGDGFGTTGNAPGRPN